MNKIQYPRSSIRNNAARSFWEYRGSSIKYIKNVAYGEFLAFKLSQALLA